jgi:HlyD family secretion protein
MKKVLIPVVVIAAAVAAWFLFFHRSADAGSFRFVPVEKGTVESVVSSTGTLRATSTVQVGTQVSGRIEDIYVDFNDHVKEGELIARIDPTLLEQEVRAARTAVERSKADLDQNTREFERADRLYKEKVVTESEYNTAQYQMAVAKTSYESAQINLDKAERNLKYTEIRAPVDGIVLERNVDVGQTVAASLQAPQLFLIAGDLSKMEILALVDESDIGNIEPGQTARFSVQAFPTRTFQGTVEQVRLQSTTQENVVNYYVAVSVDNTDGTLLPGMTATVEFIVKRAEDVLKISNAALRFQPTDAMRAEVRARRQGQRGTDGSGTPSDSTAGSRWAGRSRRGDAAAGEGPPGEGPGGFGGRNAGGNGSGTGRQQGARRTDRALLWVVDADGKVDVVPVKTGITDGQYTEISGGPKLTEGLQVIAAVTTAAATGVANPFENRQEPRGPGRGRVF